jgi:hypothetical protein
VSEIPDRPSLSAAQLATLKEIGEERTANAGDVLYRVGDRDVYAAGDVRAGSTKRRAPAVGDGAMVVQFVHAHIAREGAEIRPLRHSSHTSNDFSHREPIHHPKEATGNEHR